MIKTIVAVLALWTVQVSANNNKKAIKVNRLTIGLGAGPAGLKVSKDSKYVIQRAGVVGGIYYQRKLDNNVVVGVGAETNRTVILQVGRDF